MRYARAFQYSKMAGGNLNPRVCVTLHQQSRTRTLVTRLKLVDERRHLGLSLNLGGMERTFFILRLHLPSRCYGSHVRNANASANASEKKFVFYHRKNTSFKHLALCLQFIISFIVTSIIKILLNGRFHQISKVFHPEISRQVIK